MSNHARIREAAKKLNPIDDLMFRKMAEDKLFCEEILQVILGDRQLKILEISPQFYGTNLQGRSVIMDVKCKTTEGQEVNVEVQQANDDNHQKRVRYNGSILTTNLTDPGVKFKDVPDVCVVFIARFDIFHAKKAVYHVDRIVRETKEIVDNGFEEIYVNALCRDGSDISELMEIFTEDHKYSDKYPHTSRTKRLYKETEGGQKIMCDIMEKLRAEGVEEGRAEGREEGRAEGREEGRAEGREEGRAEGREEGRAEGREEGRAEGREEGQAEGEDRAFTLIQKLLNSGRIEDVKRVAEDSDYKKKLMKEFSIV